jgi:tetratricopeptide (TPR) repeat protein
VKTDLPENEARAAVNGFETEYGELVSAAFRGVDTTRPFDVVLLRSEDEFHEWVSPIFAGFYMSQFPLDIERSPTITMYAGGDEAAQAAARVTFLHELTHRFIARAFLPVPTWLNEGLAEYYSSMSVTDGRVTFGDMPLTMRLVTPDRPLLAKELLEADPAHFYARQDHGESGQERRTGNYASAWALVHFLKNGPTPFTRRFNTFLHLVRAEPREAAAIAWSKAFGDIPEAEFEDAYRDYVQLPSWKTYSHILVSPAPPPPATLRTMNDAEVHVVRARLLSSEHSSARVAEELTLLRAHGETPAEADYWLGALDLMTKQPAAAHDRFVGALTASPTDPRLGYADVIASKEMLAATPPPAKPDQAKLHARAVTLLDSLTQSATQVEELAMAAEYLARTARLPLAQQLIDRAIVVDPDAPVAHAVSAYILFRRGQLDDAVLEQTRAIELAGSAGVRMGPVLAEYRAARERARVNAPATETPPPRPPASPGKAGGA